MEPTSEMSNIESQPTTVENKQNKVELNEIPTETGIVQENFTTAPAQAQPVQDQPIQDNTAQAVNEEEVKEEFSGSVSGNDKSWVKRAKDVIHDFENNPYQEEEAVEDLQAEYMKKRFGVKINKADHR